MCIHFAEYLISTTQQKTKSFFWRGGEGSMCESLLVFVNLCWSMCKCDEFWIWVAKLEIRCMFLKHVMWSILICVEVPDCLYSIELQSLQESVDTMEYLLSYVLAFFKCFYNMLEVLRLTCNSVSRRWIWFLLSHSSITIIL